MAGQGQESPTCIKEVRQICGKLCREQRACINSHDGCKIFQMVLWGIRGNMVVWGNGAYSFNQVMNNKLRCEVATIFGVGGDICSLKWRDI